MFPADQLKLAQFFYFGVEFWLEIDQSFRIRGYALTENIAYHYEIFQEQ